MSFVALASPSLFRKMKVVIKPDSGGTSFFLLFFPLLSSSLLMSFLLSLSLSFLLSPLFFFVLPFFIAL